MSKGQMLKAVRSKTAVVLGAKEFFVMAGEESLHGGEDGFVDWENQRALTTSAPSRVQSGERRHQLQTSGAVPTNCFLLELKNVRAL